MKVPPGTKSGKYDINGYITTNGDMTNVLGSNTISVTQDILSYYRSLGQYPDKMETDDLLKAADDWRNNVISPCSHIPLATSQLLALADEWGNS